MSTSSASTMSPSMKKSLLITLFLLPWFSLYSKILFPSLAQAGFESSAVIIMQLIFVIFVITFCQQPRINKSGAVFATAIIAWQVSGLTSGYLSDHFHASLIKQIEIFIHCLTGYAAWILLNETKRNDQFIFALCITLAWVLYYVLAKWHSTENTEDFDWAKRTPLFNNIRHSGFILAAIFPLLYFPLIRKVNHYYLITLGLLTAYWTFVLWSGSRGTFIASVISSGIIYLAFPKIRAHLLSISVIAFLLGWLFSISAMVHNGSVNPFRLLYLDFFAASKELATHSLSSGRSGIWSATFDAALNKSIWFGLGPNGYQFITPHIWADTVQPHSAPVQLFSEYGVFGFSILFAVLTLFIINWIKHPGSSTHKIARIALICICLASVTDGHFFYNSSLLLIALISAISFAPYSQTQKSFCFKTLLLGTAILLLIPIKNHWATFIEQQFSLTQSSQLETVKSFPSYYRPMDWLYAYDSDSELRSQAIDFGKSHGPNRCHYYLMEYFESNDDPRLLTPIKEVCATYMLRRASRIELIKIAKDRGE